ncbi:MAG: zinc-binding alcohol dehydrogenase family protein [Sphaerochaeta sp.]|jgi:2-desacetyl-2-hydroxyethyl bacteriochlorophyllide A dehydrogenase|nr:zinc-binding alcohol dehydrogenase family protein [Sphaerochaeta sp.]
MKAVCIEKPWSISLVEKERPVPQEGEVLIRVKSVGICGSDIGAYRGTNQLVSYPRIIGHEIAGEIIQIPENCPSGLSIGDRVVVDPYLYCGQCYPCSIGRTNCCTDLKVLGVHVDGGMTEYFCHPATMLTKIPDGMSWEMAPLSEPLTIALHGLHRGQLKAGEHIVIFGAGPIGLLAALGALHYGAIPIVVDPVEDRLAMVRDLHIPHTINPNVESLVDKVMEYTDGRMAEMVMEASGANSAIRSSLDVVSHAGRVILTGWPKHDTELPTGVFTKKELDIRGARTSAGEFKEALELIATGKVPMQTLLTKTVSLKDAPDVLVDIEANPGSYMKVVVCID